MNPETNPTPPTGEPEPTPPQATNPLEATSPPEPAVSPPAASMPPAKPWQRLKGWVGTHHTQAATIAVAAFLILSAGGYAAYKYFTAKPPAKTAEIKAPAPPPPPPPPATKPSPLTGVQFESAVADRPILGVVIENHPNARPQSGLQSAGVVYEALAEGGITRFLAFFLEDKPKEMGPVRSVRTYFVDWALEFRAPVAHVGGNADALDLIAPLGMLSANEFANGQFFYRSRDRYAPHNAYTTGALMDQLLTRNSWNYPAKFAPSPRKVDAPPAAGAAATAPVIRINYSYGGFAVEYRYDTASNSYARFMAGAPHVDKNTGQQIMVKSVVVQYMPTSYGTTRIGEQTVIMGTPGSGQAVVFRDGGAVSGTWSKASHTDRTALKDSTGKDIPLNAGNTWYSIVPVGRTISF